MSSNMQSEKDKWDSVRTLLDRCSRIPLFAPNNEEKVATDGAEDRKLPHAGQEERFLSGGRVKYSKDDLSPLEFCGVTVVHQCTETEIAAVSDVSKHLQDRLTTSGLGHVLAFVEPSSYHITTLDLMHDKQRPLLEGTEFEYEAALGKVTEKAVERISAFKNDHRDVTTSWEIATGGLLTFGGQHLGISIPISPDQGEIFSEFRTSVQERLAHDVSAFGFIRGISPLKPFMAHITLGYMVNLPRTYDDLATYVEILKETDTLCSASVPSVSLSLGTVHSFKDMNTYTPVAL